MRTMIRSIAIGLAMVVLVGCGGEPKSAGQSTYERYCYVCHAAGTASAPRFARPEDWTERLERTDDEIFRRVVEGIPPAMPARGLCTCDDDTLRAATDYLLDSVRGENR